MGIVLLIFIDVFMRMMRMRGKLPKRVAQLAPSPGVATDAYQKHMSAERSAYGPSVALVASACLWAMFGGVMLVVDGMTMLIGLGPFFVIDALRHSLAIGFIALLICSIAPRMIPGFSGGKIASPGLVRATLWLGNTAVLLRVGSLLLAPASAIAIFAGVSLYSILFGLSGPLGLALAICLTINLLPALWPLPHAASYYVAAMPPHVRYKQCTRCNSPDDDVISLDRAEIIRYTIYTPTRGVWVILNMQMQGISW